VRMPERETKFGINLYNDLLRIGLDEALASRRLFGVRVVGLGTSLEDEQRHGFAREELAKATQEGRERMKEDTLFIARVFGPEALQVRIDL